MTARLLVTLSLMALLTGCPDDLRAEGDIAELDEAFFRCRVQPIVTKTCSTFVCHGNGARFFTVFARNRLRLGGDETGRNAFLRDSERAFNFESALTMVDIDRPEQSLLLLKPLDVSVGGYYHVGAHEPFGGTDVFLDPDDPEYQVLVDWVMGATEDPMCSEPGSQL